MEPNKQNFIAALKHAFSGLRLFFKQERNGQIHISIAAIVILASAYFDINSLEWIAILGCIALVLSLEMFNSALEKLSDMVEPNYHLTIKAIKDICAGSVLWSAIISVIIGAIIFVPKIKMLFMGSIH
jgi:diacylglycerol kinase